MLSFAIKADNPNKQNLIQTNNTEYNPENASHLNSVDILAVRRVKQGIEAERFRAVQPLVQVMYINPSLLYYSAMLVF
jgi:hypothetical protein